MKVPFNPGRSDAGQCFDCNADWVHFHRGSSSVSLDGCSLDVAQTIGDADKIPGLEVSRAGYVLEDFLDWFCCGVSDSGFTLHYGWQVDRALRLEGFGNLRTIIGRDSGWFRGEDNTCGSCELDVQCLLLAIETTVCFFSCNSEFVEGSGD